VGEKAFLMDIAIVLAWSLGPKVTAEDIMAEPDRPLAVERVQLGVRMEKRMVQVLKGLAEFEGLTLGQLLEKIVSHSFDPVPGQEGEMTASPHSKRALAAISDLKKVYGMDDEPHRYRRFRDVAGDMTAEPASRGGSS
jgi:predicted DNA-binding ribbon-helix-helix protein